MFLTSGGASVKAEFCRQLKECYLIDELESGPSRPISNAEKTPENNFHSVRDINGSFSIERSRCFRFPNLCMSFTSLHEVTQFKKKKKT